MSGSSCPRRVYDADEVTLMHLNHGLSIQVNASLFPSPNVFLTSAMSRQDESHRGRNKLCTRPGLVSPDERLFVESGQLVNPRAKNGHRSQKSIDGKVLFFYRTFQITGSSPRTGTSQVLKKWWLRISNSECSPVDGISLSLLHLTLFRVQGT